MVKIRFLQSAYSHVPKVLGLVALAVLFLTGCGPSHFVRNETDCLHFFLKDSHAREVYFASSSDGFNLHQAEKTGRETWKITIPKGEEIRYFYIIDGKIQVPSCKYREKDDFGSYNCIYVPDL